MLRIKKTSDHFIICNTILVPVPFAKDSCISFLTYGFAQRGPPSGLLESRISQTCRRILELLFKFFFFLSGRGPCLEEKREKRSNWPSQIVDAFYSVLCDVRLQRNYKIILFKISFVELLFLVKMTLYGAHHSFILGSRAFWGTCTLFLYFYFFKEHKTYR